MSRGLPRVKTMRHRESTRALSGGYSRLHHPTMSSLGASYEVELQSIDADSTVVP